ncbi:class F sortase, partial [Streptomyces sp. TRM76130]|nr:class F sortase [Streptomyces sp. TRM76130]
MPDHTHDRNDHRQRTPDREHSAAPGRLVTGIAWTVLLLGLWLWGRDATGGLSGPATGDMAAAGRPPYLSLPPAHRP